jgi:hypothetical protein
MEGHTREAARARRGISPSHVWIPNPTFLWLPHPVSDVNTDSYPNRRQPVYPILDLSHRYLDLDVPSDLTPPEKFALNMIYSVSCYIIPNTGKRQNTQDLWSPSGKQAYHQANSAQYRRLASKFHERAMEHLEAATVEPTIDTLRAVLLLAINSLFDPKTGNIGQQVALATRLAYNLEAQRELQELASDEVEVLRNMHMTIFSIENEIASALDRPATFPEPVSIYKGPRVLAVSNLLGRNGN